MAGHDVSVIGHNATALGIGSLLIERYDEKALSYERAGYMLVLLEEVLEPEVLAFDDARERVASQLAEQQSAEIGDQITAAALVAINARVHTENL